MRKIITFCLLALFINTYLFAQSSAKDKFFADYSSLIEQVRSGNGEVLSPQFYQKAVELFEEANVAYEEKEGQMEIRRILDESASFSRKALEVIKLAQLTLGKTIEGSKRLHPAR